jgi:plasmid stabilization system protein ParE
MSRKCWVLPMTKIQLSPKAIDDLQQTKEYIVKEFCSEQAAINTVFYRLENDIVRIVRILYGRRDFVQILLEESQDN